MNDPRALSDDLRAGTLAAVVANVAQRRRGGGAFAPSDFFPSLVEASPRRGGMIRDPRLMEAAMRAASA